MLNRYLKIIQEQEVVDEDLLKKICMFFKENPYPTDDIVHNFAEEIGMEHDDLERKIYAILSSFLSFGKFNESGKSESDFDPKQIEMGIKVEYEHTKNPHISKRIALDHLAEFSDYYTRLDKMENEAEDYFKGE